MPELLQDIHFDLSDALASNGKCSAHFFKSVFAAALKTETHSDDCLLPGREGF